MNLEYLENLLDNAREIVPFGNPNGDELKIKAGEAIGFLFNDLVAKHRIEHLNFVWNTPSGKTIKHPDFDISKKMLVSTLEAKIEILKSKQKKPVRLQQVSSPSKLNQPLSAY